MDTREIEALTGLTRARLAELRMDVALLQLRMALKRFNPNQPRWPTGRPDGGQWRPASDTSIANIGYDPSLIPICDAQRALDYELCRMAKSRNCWISADLRHDNCMRNAYIPPLEVGR